MSKLILTLVLTLASILSAHAHDCSIKINKGSEHFANQAEMEKALAKKGYIVISSDEAEFRLNIHYGNAMTLTDCYIFSSYMRVENSGRQTIAESSSETSFIRELLNRDSIPKAMTRKAFRKLLKKLPSCHAGEVSL